MAKFKVIEEANQVKVRCKLASAESINGGEVAYLAQNYIHGFMRPEAEATNKLLYTGAQGMPLKKYMKRTINKDQYFMMIAQILEIYKAGMHFCMTMKNIVLDPEYIIINDRTGELFFIYQTINNAAPYSDGFVSCMRELATMAKCASPNDQGAVVGFSQYISQIQRFSVPEIESYITQISPITYSIVPRQQYPPQPEPMVAAQPQQPPVQAPQQPAAGMFQQPDQGIQQFQPQPPPQPAQSFAPPVQQPEMPQSSFAPPKIEYADDDADTQQSPAGGIIMPAKRYLLFRRNTAERFPITKSYFRIGKERAKVDFCVTNNNTVSRVHATIILRDGGCYIMDNNSTNRTFINSSPILPQTEYSLQGGDVLRLSNEEFDVIEELV